MKDRDGTFRAKCLTDGCTCEEFAPTEDEKFCLCGHHAGRHVDRDAATGNDFVTRHWGV
jgi:hypothetical protein